MALKDSIDSTATDGRAENMTKGTIDNKSISKLKTGGIDMKRMVEDLNSMEDNALGGVLNNLSYRSAAMGARTSAIQGRGQYASTAATTQTSTNIRTVLDSSDNQHLQNYYAGAEAYFNNLSSVYSSVQGLADLEVQAQLYEGQNQLSWVNQALSEKEFEENKRNTNVLLDLKKESQSLDRKQFEEDKRHDDATLDQQERAQGIAEDEFAEQKRHNDVLLSQAEAAKASAGRSSSGSGYSSGYSSGSSAAKSLSQSYIDSLYSSGSSTSSYSGLKFQTTADPNPNGTKTASKKDTNAYVKNNDYDAGVRAGAVAGPEAPEDKQTKGKGNKSTDKVLFDFEGDGFFK